MGKGYRVCALNEKKRNKYEERKKIFYNMAPSDHLPAPSLPRRRSSGGGNHKSRRRRGDRRRRPAGNIGADVVIIHAAPATALLGAALARGRTRLVADERRLARHGRRGAVALASVFQPEETVGGRGLGGESGLGGGDAEGGGHGVGGGEQRHGVVVGRLGVAAEGEEGGWGGG